MLFHALNTVTSYRVTIGLICVNDGPQSTIENVSAHTTRYVT